MTLTRTDREQLLKRIDECVAEKYYDPQFNGKDWKQIVDNHHQMVVNADSDPSFEFAVNGMLADLRSSGIGIIGPHTRIPPRSSINASFRSIQTSTEGKRWVFQDVLPGGVAEGAGLRPGDILIAVAGNDILPPTEPAFAMNQRTEIAISRAGQLRSTQIDLTTQSPKYKDNPYSEPKSVAGSLLEGNTGNLKVALFPGTIGIDFANQVSAIFSGALNGANRLLIDLRGNPGGGIGGLRLMSYLTPGKMPIGYSLDRKMAEKGYNREKLPRLGHIPRTKLEIPLLALKFLGRKSVALQTEGLGKHAFHGRIVILVNEHSTGAAEMLVQFAQENRLATIVGSHTPGRLVSRSGVKLGQGYTLILPVAAYMSWNGTQIEGKGISPDVPIDWSYEASVDGRDAQFEGAISTLNSL
jgi:C-terminal processing protease CtpA/Prc